MKVIVTGCAGFIGFHVAKRLLQEGHMVAGIDNLNDYYSVFLKKDRLKLLNHPSFQFIYGDIKHQALVNRAFAQWKPDIVIHLAAQAGVRYSLENPHAYVDANLAGFVNVLECCRQYQVSHLIYASTSAVYGLNQKLPFSTRDPVDHPISLYAATKRANELLAHSYSHLFNLPTTGLRFFTVYGPWGRPDMALFLFAKAILEERPINMFNYGHMKRDFTYIDDIVEGIIRIIGIEPARKTDQNEQKDSSPDTSSAPFRIYNIGSNHPVTLFEFIEIIEAKLGKAARKRFLPMQSGDVQATYADVTELMKDVGYKPNTSLDTGIGKFIDWFKRYYGGSCPDAEVSNK